MPYFLISDFKDGLDVRKSPWTSQAGSLQQLDNAHITRGGEIEKRKEFTGLGDLLAATQALAAAKVGGAERGLVVFGSDPAPSLPAGVTYQRLQHPDGGVDMTGVAALTLFSGAPYVVADFADGSQWHFYDGALVTDWGAGIVRSSMSTNSSIAEHLRGLIDADASYAATRSGAQITVTGSLGVDYAVSSETSNVAGGVNDQSITITELEAPIAPVAGKAAVAEFAILEGTDDGGVSNYISAVRVDINGVFTELISANVAYVTSPELTAVALVSAINAGTGTHGYAASTKYGRVFIYAETNDGDSANGRVLEVSAYGNVILYSGSFAVTGGTNAGGNELTMVRVNGANIMSAAVAWATSDAATAAAIASNIVAFASSPKYNAKAVGNTVYVSPQKIRSDDSPQIAMSVVTGGDVTVGSGATPPVQDQAGGDYGSYEPPAREDSLSEL